MRNKIYYVLIVLVVIVVIVVIDSQIPQLPRSARMGKLTATYCQFKLIVPVLQEYYQDYGQYPISFDKLKLQKDIGIDPFTGKQFLYYVASKERVNDSCMIVTLAQSDIDASVFSEFSGKNIGKSPSQWLPPIPRIKKTEPFNDEGILYLQLIENHFHKNDMDFHPDGFVDIDTGK